MLGGDAKSRVLRLQSSSSQLLKLRVGEVAAAEGEDDHAVVARSGDQVAQVGRLRAIGKEDRFVADAGEGLADGIDSVGHGGQRLAVLSLGGEAIDAQVG